MSTDDTMLINLIQAASAGYTLETCLKAHILTLSLTVACSNDTIGHADEMIASITADLKNHVRLNWDVAKQAMYDQDRGGRA
jgi:hypothetical protein